MPTRLLALAVSRPHHSHRGRHPAGYPGAARSAETEYEIDLNAGHAQQLRNALAAYVRAGRRVGGGSRRPARSERRGSASGLNTTEVREWAKAQGIEVKDRGRVPAELVAKFKAATSP